MDKMAQRQNVLVLVYLYLIKDNSMLKAKGIYRNQFTVGDVINIAKQMGIDYFTVMDNYNRRFLDQMEFPIFFTNITIKEFDCKKEG